MKKSFLKTSAVVLAIASTQIHCTKSESSNILGTSQSKTTANDQKSNANIEKGTYISERGGDTSDFNQLVVAVTSSGIKTTLVTSWVTQRNSLYAPGSEEKSLDVGFTLSQPASGKLVVSNAALSGKPIGTGGTINLTKVENHEFNVLGVAAYARYTIHSTDGSFQDQDVHATVLPEGLAGGQGMSLWDARNLNRDKHPEFAGCTNPIGADDLSAVTQSLSGVLSSDPNIFKKILKDCKNRETIEVPAGIFDTCRFEDPTYRSQAVVWIGNVPTGFVKMVSKQDYQTMTPDGINLTCELFKPQVWELQAFSH